MRIGTLNIRPLSAQLYFDQGWHHHSLPYVVVTLENQIVVSKPGYGQHSNPTWDDVLYLETRGQGSFHITVWDRERFQTEFIGESDIPFANHLFGSENYRGSFPLFKQGVNVGSIVLDIYLDGINPVNGILGYFSDIFDPAYYDPAPVYYPFGHPRYRPRPEFYQRYPWQPPNPRKPPIPFNPGMPPGLTPGMPNPFNPGMPPGSTPGMPNPFNPGMPPGPHPGSFNSFSSEIPSRSNPGMPSGSPGMSNQFRQNMPSNPGMPGMRSNPGMPGMPSNPGMPGRK